MSQHQGTFYTLGWKYVLVKGMYALACVMPRKQGPKKKGQSFQSWINTASRLHKTLHSKWSWVRSLRWSWNCLGAMWGKAFGTTIAPTCMSHFMASSRDHVPWTWLWKFLIHVENKKVQGGYYPRTTSHQVGHEVVQEPSSWAGCATFMNPNISYFSFYLVGLFLIYLYH